MKLIPLEKVIKLLNTRSHYFYGDEERRNFRFAIDNIQTINPIEEIDTMIEETQERWEDMGMETMERINIQDILEELKSRLLTHK